MRPTPASRPPVAPARRRAALRFAGAAFLVGSFAAPTGWAQGPAVVPPAAYAAGTDLDRPLGIDPTTVVRAQSSAPHTRAAPRSQSRPKRNLFQKLLRLPSKYADAGRAPGGEAPPPPAPHLEWANRSRPTPAPAPVAAAPANSTPKRVAAAPTLARSTPTSQPTPAPRPMPAVGEEGVAPPPAPMRFDAPRIAAAAPAPVAAPTTTPRSPLATAALAVPATVSTPGAPRRPVSTVGRVSLSVPVKDTEPQGRFVPPTRVPEAPAATPARPAAPTLVRAPAPPVTYADDADFFPEMSEAEADGLRVRPATTVAEATPAEPETPTLSAEPTAPRPVRVAAAPTAAPIEARPAAPERAPFAEPQPESPRVAETEQNRGDTPFTGLSLSAPVAPQRTVETTTLAEPQAEEDAAFELADAEPTADAADDAPFAPTLDASDPDEEEVGWDLTVASAPPKTPTESQDAPVAAAPEAETDAPEAPSVAQAPKQSMQAEAPGRPDPTKLLEKLAARSDRSLLMGFCPVTLRDARDLAEGDARFTADYEGVTYRFASAAAREKFAADPARYAPAAGGRDLVIASTGWGETVGSLAHAAWYRGRLYLFASRESMRRFVAAPRDYLGG